MDGWEGCSGTAIRPDRLRPWDPINGTIGISALSANNGHNTSCFSLVKDELGISNTHRKSAFHLDIRLIVRICVLVAGPRVYLTAWTGWALCRKTCSRRESAASAPAFGRVRCGMRAMRTSFFLGVPAAGIPAKKSKSTLPACAPLIRRG